MINIKCIFYAITSYYQRQEVLQSKCYFSDASSYLWLVLLLRRGNQKISQTFRLTPMWIMPQSSLCCGNHNGKKDTIFLVGGVYLCLSYNEELHASYRGEQQGKHKQRGSNWKEQIPNTKTWQFLIWVFTIYIFSPLLSTAVVLPLAASMDLSSRKFIQPPLLHRQQGLRIKNKSRWDLEFDTGKVKNSVQQKFSPQRVLREQSSCCGLEFYINGSM